MESTTPADNMTQRQVVEAFEQARVLTQLSFFTHCMRAAVQLNVFDILSEHGSEEQPLSASQISAFFTKQNVEKTPIFLDRMLSLFASFSLLKVTQTSRKQDEETAGHDQVQRLYTLTPVGKYFVTNNVEGSFTTFLLLLTEPIERDIWSCLKDAMIEGISPPEKAFGAPIFQVMSQRPETGKIFNKTMSELTTISMTRLLVTYKGFNDVTSLVDIGGGDGSCLKMIISKYPHIKGINFDLPQVIDQITPATTDAALGITYVAGDMFVRVPKGDAVFLKYILHDWGDEECVKLLKLCYDAIPKSGKVIVIEAILPETLSTATDAKDAYLRDVTMFILPGAKERTREQFIALSRAAGFSDARFITSFSLEWVIEFHK